MFNTMSDKNSEEKQGFESTHEEGGEESLDYSSNERRTRDAVKSYYEDFRKEQGEIDEELDKKINNPLKEEIKNEKEEIKKENTALGNEVVDACIGFDDELKQKTQDSGHGIEQNEKIDGEKVLSAESPELVSGGADNVKDASSDPGAKEDPDKSFEEKKELIEESVTNKEAAMDTEAGTEGESGQEKKLSEKEVKERADAIESTEEYFFGEGKRSQAEQSMVEEYKNAKKEDAENNNTVKTDEVIAKTGQGFAEKLKLPPNYKEDAKAKKEIVDAKLAIDEKLTNSEMMQGAENGEINFMAIIDKGQKLLQEGNPEEIKKYFGGMADTLDDCAKRSQYIYARMEGDPEMKAALKDEYITLVTNVQKFGEASEVMRKLAKKAETAQVEHRALSAEEMEEMTSLLDVLRKAALVMMALGAALYTIAKYSKEFAVAHPIVAKIVGSTAVVAGTKAATMVIPAALAGKGLFWIGAFIALMKEKKRDDVIQAIFQFKLPAALQAKDDSKKEGK